MSHPQRPTIAIDIDDVLADTTQVLRVHVNDRFNLDLKPEHYNIPEDYWGYYERVWERHGLVTEGIFQGFVDKIINSEMDIPLLPSADFAIKELSKSYKIIFITARDSAWEDATRKWFRYHFDNKNVDLYFTNSHNDSKAKNKGELCVELGASLLIDDNIQHCLSAINQGIDAILFGEYGWQHTVPKEIIRCTDWPATLEYIDGR